MKLLAWLACVLAGMVAPVAHGDAGIILFARGEASILRQDGSIAPAGKGVAVHPGDTIVTSEKGVVQLRMVDEARAAVRPDSVLKIEEYRNGGSGDDEGRAIFKLIRGGFRSLTGLIGRRNKENYEVRAADAVIGIRGTDHEPVLIPPHGWRPAPDAIPGVYDRVNAGETYIRNEAGTVVLSANQTGFAPLNRMEAPRRLPAPPAFFSSALPQRGTSGPTDGKRDASAGQPATAETKKDEPSALAATSATSVTTAEAGAGTVVPPPPIPPALPELLNSLTLPVAGVGGELTIGTYGSQDEHSGAGAGIDGESLNIQLDAGSRLVSITSNSSDHFVYTRGNAQVVEEGAASFVDGGQTVGIKWGVYAGGTVVNNNQGTHVPDYFFAMTAMATPMAAIPQAITYTTTIACTPPIDESGGRGGLASAIASITGGALSSYSLSVQDSQNRNWSAGCTNCNLSLAEFVRSGALLSGTGPGNVPLASNTSNSSGSRAYGVVVGPTGQGMISSYFLRTETLTQSSAYVTGAVALKAR